MAIPRTKSKLVTSYKLFVTAQDSTRREIGMVTTASPSERRTITPTFVIGNNPPDEPFELVPDVVRDKTLRVSRLALYTKTAMEALGRDNQSIVAALSDQNTPFDIAETVTDPNTSKTQTRTYQGCWISDYGSERNMAQGDIRELETVTIMYTRSSQTSYQ